MKTLPEPLEFEWDEWNLTKSQVKHEINPEEAESVFVDLDGLVLPDEKHSLSEKRYLFVGRSNKNRYLLVSFTIRTKRVRIISVRRMHQEEVAKYEEIKK